MDVMPDGQSSHCVKESSLVQSRTFSYTDPLWMRNVDLPATEGNAPIDSSLTPVPSDTRSVCSVENHRNKIENTKSVSQVNDY